MYKNKNIVVLGMAKSGYETAKFLAVNNKVTINDFSKNQDEQHINELKKLGVNIILGSHPDNLIDKNVDMLIKNPGIAIDHKYVLKAKELGIEVINEVEVAFRCFPGDVKLIAITGTNGKTTTTTIIYNILKNQYGDKVHLTGNIGYPLISFLNKIHKGDIVVIEVSVQQLENLVKFKPNIAVLTNISPAHLEFFPSYDYYKILKQRIFSNQDKNDLAIINFDDKESMKLTENILSHKEYYSLKNSSCISCLKNTDFIYDNIKVLNIDNIKLVGNHNYQNILAAITVAKTLNVTNKNIIKFLKEFKGVEHRLEFVDEIDGVKYYNDTQATNIKCTQIALDSFDEETVLILGGYERGEDFTELKPYMKNVSLITAIGETSDRIIKELSDYNVINCHTLEMAMDYIKEFENKKVVLLSPASASWDQYKKAEVRGDEFKALVSKLK